MDESIPNLSDEEKKPPSKSQRKREMHALQALGESLLRLQPVQLKKLPLSQELRQAILNMQAIASSKHGALRRQRQFIGKLMRQEDVTAIEQALNNQLLHPVDANKSEGNSEPRRDWIQELTADATRAMSALLEEYPELDRQTVRNSLRNMQRAKTEEQRQRARLKLSNFLKQNGVF